MDDSSKLLNNNSLRLVDLNDVSARSVKVADRFLRAAKKCQYVWKGLNRVFFYNEGCQCKGEKLMMPDSLFAVIPTLGMGAPLAILAMLFPGLFGGIFLLFRQWTAFFTILSINGLLIVLHWGFSKPIAESWFETRSGLLLIVLAMTFLGMLWAWQRSLAFTSGKNLGTPPKTTERMVLFVLFLGFLSIAIWYYLDPPLILNVTWIQIFAFGVGISLAFLRCLFCWPKPDAKWTGVVSRVSTEGLILTGMFLTMACFYVQFTFASSYVSITSGSMARQGGFLYVDGTRPGTVVSSPLIAGDQIYLGMAYPSLASERGILKCWDCKSNSLLWSFSANGTMKPIFSSPCISGDQLLIGEGFHDDPNCRVFCLDRHTGKQLWEFQTTSQVESTPVVAGDAVFVGAGNDGIYSLEAETGKMLWVYPDVPGEKLFRVGAGPLVANGKVFVGAGVDRFQPQISQPALACLDARTGKADWHIDVDLPCWSKPLLLEKQLVVALGNGDILSDATTEPPAGAIVGLSPDTGKQIWRCDLPNGVLASPVYHNTKLYFGCRDGQCFCIDSTNGHILWQTNVGSPIIGSVALHSMNDEAIAVFCLGSDGTIACLSAEDGKNQWTDRQLQQYPAFLASTPTLLLTETFSGTVRQLFLAGASGHPTNGTPFLFRMDDFFQPNLSDDNEASAKAKKDDE